MGVISQVKQAMQMRKDAKRIQAEVEKISFTYQNAGITCVVKGDLKVASIKVSEEAINELINATKATKVERFETMLKTVINGALAGVKTETQNMMQAMMKEGNNPVADLIK